MSEDGPTVEAETSGTFREQDHGYVHIVHGGGGGYCRRSIHTAIKTKFGFRVVNQQVDPAPNQSGAVRQCRARRIDLNIDDGRESLNSLMNYYSTK